MSILSHPDVGIHIGQTDLSISHTRPEQRDQPFDRLNDITAVISPPSAGWYAIQVANDRPMNDIVPTRNLNQFILIT